MRILNRRRFCMAGGAMLGLSPMHGRAQPTALRVGVLTDMTGVYSDSIGSGSVLAARMAAEDVGGSVLGRTIEILSADNQNKADIGSAIARQWYERDGVNLIVGLDNSAVALAVEQVARERSGIVIAIAVSTNDFTGRFCTPTAMSWNYDSYALTHGVARTLVARGLDSWFFLAVDFAFGTALETSASDAVRSAGGRVLGSVRHPIDAGDFSSFLLAAKASGAKVVALASGGADMTNAVKQAAEFGIPQGGQTLVPLLCTIQDIHSLGLSVAHGMTLMTSFTWNRTDQTRGWSERFFARHHTMPSMSQAATYSAVLHYLRAVAAAGGTDSTVVAARMRAMPVQDVYANEGHIRADGRLLHDMYLIRVKQPAESKTPWDYEAILQTVPGDQAFRPLADAGCPLAEKT
ncbi:ABC transporter substrate-binding protein [Rhodopila sp.]|uniref:ABC transporter substrate-binding protein n=1 Tax=Rhodopila sp. TaxID=2480087 RepID=UPI003D0F16F3